MTVTEPVVAYIGLGSNLNNPAGQIRAACAALALLPASRVLATSALYGNPPLGPADQPDYLNAVLALETRMPPHELLRELQSIETAQGRVRGAHWGPRTLDLDLLLYGWQQVNDNELTLPHPGLATRAFVLHPLLEIAPDLTIPGAGSLREMAARVPSTQLTRIAHD